VKRAHHSRGQSELIESRLMRVEAEAVTSEDGRSWWRYETTADHSFGKPRTDSGGSAEVFPLTVLRTGAVAKKLSGHIGSLEAKRERVAQDQRARRPRWVASSLLD
jgi:hypothetical protein